MQTVDIPGDASLELTHLVLDVNGTLTERGELMPGVAERLQSLRAVLDVHLVTADTLGTAAPLGDRLGLQIVLARTGEDKAAFVEALGAEATVAIGNGRNDEGMLRAARLGMAVVGPEGAASAAINAADLVCRSVTEALDLLLDPRLLVATLRP